MTLATHLDNAFRDDIALHDASEDVDHDCLHALIGSDDLERSGDLVLLGRATHLFSHDMGMRAHMHGHPCAEAEYSCETNAWWCTHQEN